MLKLNSEIIKLKGVGEKVAANYHKLGIYNIYDLITFYPKDYIGYKAIADIDECSTYCKSGEPIALKLFVKNTPRINYMSKPKIVSAIGENVNGAIELTWFNSLFMAKTIKPGKGYVFYGRLRERGSSYVMIQPKVYSESEYNELSGKVGAVYSLTKGITSSAISKNVLSALAQIEPIEEYLEPSEGMMEINEAIKQIHNPSDKDSLLEARNRLVFNEFFCFISMIRQVKERDRKLPNGYKCIEVAQTKILLEKLPYRLTKAQINCFVEIKNDLSGDYIMNRLIQGDVGSGKTIVAILSLLMVASNGYQGAMMAPTEVLARQHMDTVLGLVSSFGIKCALLVGSMSEREKKETREAIASGEASIIIGTHALIQDSVSFKNLALAITDEQHRFGVRQREKLGGNSHVLVMSATPIPRTLGIIMYGDLDISVIDEKPSERLPIKNCVVGPNFRPKAYQFIEKEVREGHQALVVCPMVEESESLDAENVIDYTEKLRGEFSLGVVVEYLHGKMKNSEKNDIMNRFAKGDIDVLVSTTVIEVGINVPNTTVMMVENAERFGLSQLHQLRGRVGRGGDQSYCIFMCGKDNKDTLKKLDILNKSNDGFKIAEEDLAQRGPGDFFGQRQSGEMSFKLGDIISDSSLLKRASDYANTHPLMDNDQVRMFSGTVVL